MRLAVVVLIMLTLPASAAAAAKPCAVHKQDELVTATKAAVIARHTGRDASTYRGCLKSVGRWRTLVKARDDGLAGDDPLKAALGGRYAAVAVFTGDFRGMTGTVWVRIVNLRTGGRRQPLTIYRNDGSAPHDYALLALALSRYGTLGWIDGDYAVPDPPAGYRETVHGHDAHGTRVLDAGDGADMSALGFHAATLRWKHDGQPREAPLGTR